MMLRVEKLRKKMQEENLDAFLVTSPDILRYLTNFTGNTDSAFLIWDKEFLLN
ncbi:aminopeptidase P family protein, partial [Enterococcus faecium]|uniref:aminopeptidase P family N-terminal domain-containing protein n=1 Tax=Enterococcus faecium TaxID=1352 RepID=UPI000E17A947